MGSTSVDQADVESGEGKLKIMGQTKIEWTERTWNPVRGCSVVSEGCRNCYAMNFATRFAGEGEPYEGLAYRNSSGGHWTGKVRLIEEHLKDPIKWRKPQMIFVNSMSDLFHESIPNEWIHRIFSVMGDCSELRGHVFQVLTKRPARMLEYMERWARKSWNAPRMNRSSFPPSNIWLGVSVEDQKTADERIPLLLQAPAAVRWISAEPLLGHVDLKPYLEGREEHAGYPKPGACVGWTPPLDWVVVGGESGPKARPMHPDWARSLRDQCAAAGVPFFFKQWGEWKPDEQVQTLDLPGGASATITDVVSLRVGKKASGRLLDGREWSEYPKEQAKAVSA